MDRRAFLTVAGGLIAEPAVAALGARRADEVVVVGAGIVGASIAYHLAKSGVKVTVLEKRAPATGTTANSFAYLNAGRKAPRAYFDLNLLGMLGWYRLQDEIGDKLPIQWGGTVEWAETAELAKALEELIRQVQKWGYPAHLIGEAEIVQLLPGATLGAVTAASFSEIEGTLDPIATTKALLAQAQRHGAKLEFPVAVTGLEMNGTAVRTVQTEHGPIAADAVVLACGNDTPALAAMAGQTVPLVESRGILAHADARPRSLNRVILAPAATIKQNPKGGFVTGESFAGTEGTLGTRELGLHMLRNAARYWPSMASATLLDVTVGYRVMPKDGFPIVGFFKDCPNLYVAATHSGVTLAPIVGQLAAMEIAYGAEVSPFETFRPSRFT